MKFKDLLNKYNDLNQERVTLAIEHDASKIDTVKKVLSDKIDAIDKDIEEMEEMNVYNDSYLENIKQWAND